MSEKNFKNHWSKNPEIRKIVINKLINKNMGKKHSEETRKKISQELKKAYAEGRMKPVEGIGKWNIGNSHVAWNKGKTSWSKGLTFSEEHKKKISESNKGKKRSNEFKENCRNRQLGKNLSQETKNKMSEIKKGIIPKNIELFKKFNIGKKFPIKLYPNYGFRAQYAKNIVYPFKDTSIETKIQNYLKQLGIDFFTHQYIKEIEHGYQCDILIPSMNLIIECDGDYWHKYPIGTEIDHIRTSELLNKGFKVLRLWENEIKVMNIDGFKKKLEEIKWHNKL